MHNSSKINDAMGIEFPLEILLADDNIVNRKVGAAMLGKLGYECDLAVDGLEAMEMLRAKVYDILFVDLQMPRMDGFEATAALRKEFDATIRPIIIAMTGSAGTDDRAECLRAGMDDHISKPVRIEELRALLLKWAKALPGRRGEG